MSAATLVVRATVWAPDPMLAMPKSSANPEVWSLESRLPNEVAEVPPTVQVVVIPEPGLPAGNPNPAPTTTATPDAALVCVHDKLATLAPNAPADEGPTASNATPDAGPTGPASVIARSSSQTVTFAIAVPVGPHRTRSSDAVPVFWLVNGPSVSVGVVEFGVLYRRAVSTPAVGEPVTSSSTRNWAFSATEFVLVPIVVPAESVTISFPAVVTCTRPPTVAPPRIVISLNWAPGLAVMKQ